MQKQIKVILTVLMIIILFFSIAKIISFSLLVSIEITIITILDFLNNYEICSSSKLKND